MADIDALIWKHRYEAAEREARLVLERHSTSAAAHGLLCRALKAQGRYEEAMHQLELAMAPQNTNDLSTGPELDRAVLLWMVGRQPEAITRVQELVVGVLDGRVRYADRAGGVLQGLLLRYMSLSLGDYDVADLAQSYLRSRSSRSEIELWPGPLALLYLGQIDFREVLERATGEEALFRAEQTAATDLAKRRRLAVALFYEGARHAARSDFSEAHVHYAACTRLENPIIENEWYLAQYELAQRGRQIERGAT